MKKIVVMFMLIILICNLMACSASLKTDVIIPIHNKQVMEETRELKSNGSKEDNEMTEGYEYETLITEIIALFFAFIGGGFALYQWHKSTVYKRTEVVRGLIESVRGDPDIASIMDIIDWDEDFTYDGKFSVRGGTERTVLINISDDELFNMIDKTLAMFSYICYLKQVHTITNRDMRFFEYELRRLLDNQHIRNYLYSLYHWSKSLDVEMSFSYVIHYGLRKKYLDKSFKVLDDNNTLYECFLEVGR